MNRCIITFRSQTSTLKASRFLKRNGINAEVVSVDPSFTSGGCGWGTAVDCSEIESAKRKLEKKGIPFGDVLSGGI